jgi:deazaflavin-dependent oxidoreductase (nitroreductase family)
MAVELTPRGTRGGETPRLLRPLMGAMSHMRVQGQLALLLSTVGAKTGKLRQTVLCWFPDSDALESDNSWLVVASGAGSARHPAWFVNMARNPDRVSIEIRGRQIKVEPQSLRGEERAASWRKVVALAPDYAAYEKRTDREIRIIRLRAMG